MAKRSGFYDQAKTKIWRNDVIYDKLKINHFRYCQYKEDWEERLGGTNAENRRKKIRHLNKSFSIKQ